MSSSKRMGWRGRVERETNVVGAEQSETDQPGWKCNWINKIIFQHEMQYFTETSGLCHTQCEWDAWSRNDTVG